MTFFSDLSGKVALVTGASSGLGRHFATVLSRHGVKVALGARRLDALQDVAAGIRAQGGIAAAVPLDVTSSASIAKPLLEQTESDWDAVVEVNLKGAFLVASEVARHMRDTQRVGSIINIESILSFRQAGSIAPYAASKAGLTQLTRSMALELARFRIRVNGIAPGYFATDINREFFATEPGRAMIKRIPQRRLGELSDLEGPLLLLASDASRYMTGATLVVDGGHLCSSL
jgi:NAD(P)-dependent dehydrogenase (short-subunit alcohol dehydrogenase family)